jgi:hypothetical protein
MTTHIIRIYASDILEDGTVSSFAISRECQLIGAENIISLGMVNEIKKYLFKSGSLENKTVTIQIGSQETVALQFVAISWSDSLVQSFLGLEKAN